MLNRKLRRFALIAVTIVSATTMVALTATLASAATAHPTAAGGSASGPASSVATQGERKATAVPDTTPWKCTFGSSSGNVQTCFQIVGGGLFVDNMNGSACVFNSKRTLHIEITGPSFTVNSPTYTLPPGVCNPVFVHVVNGPVKAGTYTAITWRENAGGSYTNIGEVTQRVVS
jgi:hypothetical protein